MLRDWQRLTINEEAPTPEPNPGGGGENPPPANQELFSKDDPTPEPNPEPENPDMPEWKKALPDELRNAPSLKAFNDVEALAKSYVNTKKLVGADKIPVPTEHASEADWKEVFNKLGLPETETDYKVDLSKEISEALNPDHFKVLKEAAYKLNVLPHQLKGLVETFHQIDSQAAENFAAEQSTNITKALDELKDEWGVAYDANLGRATKLMRDIADDKDWDFIEKQGFTKSPQLVRLFGKLADKLYGEAEIKDGGEIRNGALTPSEALAKIEELRGEKAYMQADHPKHSAVIKEIDKLYNMAYPPKSS